MTNELEMTNDQAPMKMEMTNDQAPMTKEDVNGYSFLVIGIWSLGFLLAPLSAAE